MARIHVLLKKEELDRERLAGKVVVVLDVLFATSTIVTALAHGAREVVPMLDGPSALAEARLHPPGSYVLSGELDASTLPGFAHPTPLALLGEDLAHKALVYSTTNGTVALSKSKGAAHVYAAALLNGEAVVAHLARAYPDDTVLVVCSGSADRVNLEDLYGAGYLVSLFAARGGNDAGPYGDWGSALVPTVEVHDGQGNLLSATSADRLGATNFAESVLRPDPMIEASFRAPAAGDYIVVVSDANAAGGPSFFYALQVWKNQ
jgi:2-phosphosulfolactate phosphatase